MKRWVFVVSALFIAALACRQEDEAPPMASESSAMAPAPETPTSLAGGEWHLLSLGERVDPKGNGGKPITLQFDTTAGSAGGNAGCNRYSGPYRVVGDSISFGALISTKMACPDVMEIENEYLSALSKVVRYQIADSTLSLLAAEGPVARFVRGPN